MKEGIKRGFFETELLLDVEVTYEFKEEEGEILLEDTKIELGNRQNIDLHDYLSIEILNKIDADILEDIEYDKK